jgi:hypothetical protein
MRHLASLRSPSQLLLGTLGMLGLAALASPAAAQTTVTTTTVTCNCPGGAAATVAPAAPVAPMAPMAPVAMGVGPGGMPAGVVMMPAVAPAPERWQQHRFGIGLRFGSMGIEDKDAAGRTMEEGQQFATGGLVARYRATRRLELELSFDHGTQQIEGDDGELYETDLELTTATASVLFHMRPQARWDWYLLGGLGVNDRRFHGDPDELADTRGHVAIGAGLERRWEHLVLGVELRALAIGPKQEEERDVAIAAAAQPVEEEDEGLGGGQLTFSAGWYF